MLLLKIKISSTVHRNSLLNQSPGRSGVWSDCKFYINEEVKDCDLWVVYEGLSSAEECVCAPENVMLITGEPPSIKEYNKKFLSQFNIIQTCQKNLVCNNILLNQQALPWHVGKELSTKKEVVKNRDFDFFVNHSRFDKDKDISIILSNKSSTKGHKDRLDFLDKLVQKLGSRVDVFGKGIRPIEDKWDAISPYRYHIALENSLYSDYWTEKIADSFLGMSMPIYHGCPNITEYFDGNSLVHIDINNIDYSIEKIKRAIDSDLYNSNVFNIEKSRDLVLNKYNIFPMLAEYAKLHLTHNTKPKNIKIVPENLISKNRFKSFIKGSLWS